PHAYTMQSRALLEGKPTHENPHLVSVCAARAAAQLDALGKSRTIRRNMDLHPARHARLQGPPVCPSADTRSPSPREKWPHPALRDQLQLSRQVIECRLPVNPVQPSD